MGPGSPMDIEHDELPSRDSANNPPPSGIRLSVDPDAVTLASSSEYSTAGSDGNPEWWNPKPSIVLLLPALLLLMLAEGALIAPTLNALLTLVCRAYYMQPSDLEALDGIEPDCQTAGVHAAVSRFAMILQLLQGIMPAIVSPRLGALSDRFGRRPILALAALGPLCSTTILVAATKSTGPRAYILVLMLPILPQLTGSLTTIKITAKAYVTDCTPPRQRAYTFGIYQACLLLGTAAGPALGAVVIQLTGSDLSSMYFALVLQILFALFVVFILPESLSRAKIVEAQEVHRIATEFAAAAEPRDFRYYIHRLNFLQPLKVLWPTDGTRLVIKKNIVILTVINTLVGFASQGVIASLLFYAEYTFHWTTAAMGLYISLISGSRVISLLVVLPAITYFYKRRHAHELHEVRMSKSDTFIIKISLVCEVVSYMLLALAPNGAEFAVAGTLGGFGILYSPIIMSAITKHVPAENTGAVLGAVSLMDSLSDIVSPVVFSNIYASTVAYYPKAIFVASIIVFVIACVFSLLVTEQLGGSLYDSGDGLDIGDRRQQPYSDQDPTIELDPQSGSSTEEM
ncbi:major facilitator superfamily domain-containing protein [Lipomyces kononenkoae]